MCTIAHVKFKDWPDGQTDKKIAIHRTHMAAFLSVLDIPPRRLRFKRNLPPSPTANTELFSHHSANWRFFLTRPTGNFSHRFIDVRILLVISMELRQICRILAYHRDFK